MFHIMMTQMSMLKMNLKMLIIKKIMNQLLPK